MGTSQLQNQAAGTSWVLQQLLSEKFKAKLERLAVERTEEYLHNLPFPHAYFDDFLPTEVAEEALRVFPDPDELDWIRHRGEDQHRKLAFDVVESVPASIRDILYFLNSRPMVHFLEVLTGIQSVLGDPYYEGGGLHQIRPGGALQVHADFSYHRKLRLDRRINVLIYLNKNWNEEYGGHFELWNRDLTHAEQRILPIFNRCAIFSTTSYSYHGHPKPLTCPPDRTRKSIATYYYTNGRPEEAEGLTTAHAVAFVRPQGSKEPISVKLKKAAHALTPPIVVAAYRKLRK